MSKHYPDMSREEADTSKWKFTLGAGFRVLFQAESFCIQVQNEILGYESTVWSYTEF